MRISMVKTHNFPIPGTDRRQTAKYKANCRYTVKRDWGLELIGLGVAKEIKIPTRKPVTPPDGD